LTPSTAAKSEFLVGKWSVTHRLVQACQVQIVPNHDIDKRLIGMIHSLSYYWNSCHYKNHSINICKTLSGKILPLIVMTVCRTAPLTMSLIYPKNSFRSVPRQSHPSLTQDSRCWLNGMIACGVEKLVIAVQSLYHHMIPQ